MLFLSQSLMVETSIFIDLVIVSLHTALTLFLIETTALMALCYQHLYDSIYALIDMGADLLVCLLPMRVMVVAL